MCAPARSRHTRRVDARPVMHPVVLVGALAAVPASFWVLLSGDLVGLHAAVEALVVPASFVLAGVLGGAMGTRPAVAGAILGVGMLHLLAVVVSVSALLAVGRTPAAVLNTLSHCLYAAGFALLVLVAAAYPEGRPGRWAATVARAGLAVAVVLPLAAGLAGPVPTVLQPGRARLELGPVASLLPGWVATWSALVLVLPLVATAVFVVRYLRAGPSTRARMRWPVLGVGLVAILALSGLLLGSSLPGWADALFLVAVPLLPLSLVVGAAERDLFDVDLLLRRTAVFGGTWMVAATAYGIGVSASAWAAGGRGFAVAALMGGVLSLLLATPVRRRLLRLTEERGRLEVDLAEKVDLLTRRGAELDESRRRLARATEAERLRVERDLHDGVQQELLAVIAQLEAARIGLAGDPDRAGRAVTQALELARGAYETVRSVSQGLRPQVLDDLGLVGAISSRAALSPVPVTVLVGEGVDGVRWPPEVEGAAYFVAQEGLANVIKHSGARRAVTEVRYHAGELVVEVRDDGQGGLDPARGTGLVGLRDRLEAVGGRLHAVEADGWTRVTGRLTAGPVVP